MNPNTTTEYRNLPLNVLIPSKTNPRRIIEDDSLRELAESISVHGVLEPLIVRPVTERDFEVVVGGRRFAASKKAGKDDAPCSIRNLTDAQVLEIQLVENRVPGSNRASFRHWIDQSDPIAPVPRSDGSTNLLRPATGRRRVPLHTCNLERQRMPVADRAA